MKPFAIFFLLLATLPGWGQRLMGIEELDDDGRTRILTDGRIVDVNSTLNLAIDTSALKREIGKLPQPGLPPDFVSRLNTVRELLQARERTAQLFAEATALYARSPDKIGLGYDRFVQAVGEATAPALRLVTRFPEIRANYNVLAESLDEGDPAREAELVFEAAGAVIREWETQLDEFLRRNGLYVQMGAWLVRPSGETPLHLEGFDTYAVGQRYVIERFAIALTDEQKQQLADLDRLARQINQRLEGQRDSNRVNAGVVLQNVLKEFEKTATFRELNRLKSLVDSLSKAHATTGDALSALLTPLRTDLTAYADRVQKTVERYRTPATGLTGDALLAQVNQDVGDLLAATRATLQAVDGKHLPALRLSLTALAARAKTDAQLVVRTAEAVRDAAEADVASLRGALEPLLRFFRPTSFDETALRFSEKVKKLSLDDLPTTTSLSIPNAGPREEGDFLVLRIGSGFGEGEVRFLETRRLYLYKTIAHVETTVGIVFADPWSAQSPLLRKFQAAASYSVLLKGVFDRGIRRRNVAYHRVMDAGIGLNVAATDFDKDDIPELGVGLVVSLFRDYVQGGVGYNVFLDKAYGFFGLRLPMPTFNLVGSGSK